MSMKGPHEPADLEPNRVDEIFRGYVFHDFLSVEMLDLGLETP
jgi:hypothetical protein